MNLIRMIKDALKSHFYYHIVREKLHPGVGIQQRQLFHHYSECARRGKVPGLGNTGFRVFSQFEEDGKLLYVLALTGMKTRRFVEIGSDDGINSNCANLWFHFGYHGLFIDSNAVSIRRGKRFYRRHPNPWQYQPRFLCAMVTRENINSLLEQEGFNGEVDLLSIDIDGNDYWIWDAIEVCSPRVVIIEAHVEFGFHDVVVPYDPEYVFPGRHHLYHGASPMAIANLAQRKGYRLVGANNYGHNMIFVKEELCGELLPEKSLKEILCHPSATESFLDDEQMKSMGFLKG